MRLIRVIRQCALHPFATGRRRTVVSVVAATLGIAFPTGRLIAAATVVATIVGIIQLVTSDTPATSSTADPEPQDVFKGVAAHQAPAVDPPPITGHPGESSVGGSPEHVEPAPGTDVSKSVRQT